MDTEIVSACECGDAEFIKSYFRSVRVPALPALKEGLRVAIERGHIQVVIAMIRKKYDGVYDLFTIFQWARKLGKMDVIQELCERLPPNECLNGLGTESWAVPLIGDLIIRRGATNVQKYFVWPCPKTSRLKIASTKTQLLLLLDMGVSRQQLNFVPGASEMFLYATKRHETINRELNSRLVAELAQLVSSFRGWIT